LIEADALETSPLVRSSIREAKLPSGVILGAVVRGEDVYYPARKYWCCKPEIGLFCLRRPMSVKKV
jgi:trk system potassium uptake protein TrkA